MKVDIKNNIKRDNKPKYPYLMIHHCDLGRCDPVIIMVINGSYDYVVICNNNNSVAYPSGMLYKCGGDYSLLSRFIMFDGEITLKND